MQDDRRMRIRPEPPEPGSQHKPDTKWMRKAPEAIELVDTGEPTPGDRWVAKDWECWAVGVGDKAIASFENRADAMLDKAAPDLLAACEHAVTRLVDEIGRRGGTVGTDPTLFSIRAAIAKARGEDGGAA